MNLCNKSSGDALSILENLRESYGSDFSLTEGDIRALLESVKAATPALVEQPHDA